MNARPSKLHSSLDKAQASSSSHEIHSSIYLERGVGKLDRGVCLSPSMVPRTYQFFPKDSVSPSFSGCGIPQDCQVNITPLTVNLQLVIFNHESNRLPPKSQSPSCHVNITPLKVNARLISNPYDCEKNIFTSTAPPMSLSC